MGERIKREEGESKGRKEVRWLERRLVQVKERKGNERKGKERKKRNKMGGAMGLRGKRGRGEEVKMKELRRVRVKSCSGNLLKN